MTTKERQIKFVTEVRRCDPIIYRVCKLYGCRMDESVEDLYQEIVCSLWESYDTFHGDSSFSTWVYSVARNTAVSYYRRHQLRQPKVTLVDFDHASSDWADTSDSLVTELYKMLDRLNADDRALVGLYLDGFSSKDMAEYTHLSETAVRTRLSRIKVRLKKMNDILKRKGEI